MVRTLIFVLHFAVNSLFSLMLFAGSVGLIGALLLALTGVLNFPTNDEGNTTTLLLLIWHMALLSGAMMLSLAARLWIYFSTPLQSYATQLRWPLMLGSGTIVYLEQPISLMKQIYRQRGEQQQFDLSYYLSKAIFHTALTLFGFALLVLVPMGLTHFAPSITG